MVRDRFFRASRLAALVGVLVAGVAPGVAPALAQALAQARRPATVRVTVLDPSGAVIVGARVEVHDGDRVVAAAVTDERGTAELAALEPRGYDIVVESEGFERARLQNQRLKSGNNRREVTLAIAAVLEDVTVERDPRERATDPRGDAFNTVLSKEEIDALPDDPDELEQTLQQMAGPGAVMRVNGFRGGSLPPKSQIREIRFRRNMFAADTHESSHMSIDIISQPGADRWRGSVSAAYRDESMNARNAFAEERTPEQTRRGQLSLDGPLVKNRTSVSLNVDGLSAFDSRTILAALPTSGTTTGVVRRPTDRVGVNLRLEHALSKTQTLRAEWQQMSNEIDNLGVGEFDLPERAFTRSTSTRVFRAAASGGLGRRTFNEARFQVRFNEQESLPALDEAAVRVLDAFTFGGASSRGRREATEWEFADNLDLNIGRHAIRTGVLFERGRYDSTDISNANGTFTFSSLDDWNAGRPSTYSQRLGDPRVEYSVFQGAWYVQDDIRVSKALLLSAGLRHEWQSHVASTWNLAPRVGFAWSPFEDAKTTFRGGAGIFYDWYEAATFEQTQQVDGTTVQDITIRNPGYPDPFAGTGYVVLPRGRVVQDRLELPQIRQASIGVERALPLNLRMNVSYAYREGINLLRGVNVNAPGPDGTRPDPGSGNVTEIQSIGHSRGHVINVGINGGAPARGLFSAVHYTWSRARDDGNGALTVSPTGLLFTEWGPSANDIRHRLFVFFNTRLPWNFRVGGNLRAESGAPYNITTGRDDNGDTLFNDRPDSVGRNAGRGSATVDLGVRLAWQFGFGKRGDGEVPMGGGPQVVRIRMGGDGPGGGGGPMGPMGASKRVNAELYLQAFNVLNRVNEVGYSGVMTSPFFGQATWAQAARRFELGMRVMF